MLKIDLISRDAVLDLAKDLVFNMGERTEYKYRCIDPTAVQELPSAMCKGYDVRDLIIVSGLCQAAGITPSELKCLVKDTIDAINAICGAKIESEETK